MSDAWTVADPIGCPECGLEACEEHLPPEPQAARRGLSGAATRRVRLTPASAILMRPVRWLWLDRLALGTLGLIGGREGIGKSILAYTIAALVTRGRLPGVFDQVPRGVIVAASEDSWEHTIVPRLLAASADLDRVFRVDVVTMNAIDTALSLPRDLNGLEHAVADVDAAAIILDPLLSRLDTDLDSHKDAEVRRALEPVVALADRTDATVLGLIHVNKSASNDALTTLMGSRAFAAVARSVLFVMIDPDDQSMRLIGQAKNNLGRCDLPTLSFRIDGVKVADMLEGQVWTGKLEWTGESHRSIRDVLEASAEAFGDRSATTEAADWLKDYLVSRDSAADSAVIKREGARAGHSKDALRRAKRQLGIASFTSGFPRKAIWSLPAQSEQLTGETSTTALNAPTAPNGHQAAHGAQSAHSVEGSAVRAPNGSFRRGI